MTAYGISTDPNLLGVGLTSNSLTESPSVSTFLPEEDASICPLLPATPSPPPMNFIHPLTSSNTNAMPNGITDLQEDDAQAETSSSGSSSGIGIQVPSTASTTLFNKLSYQHLGKNGDLVHQDKGVIGNGMNGHGHQKQKGPPDFVTWNWPVIRKCTFFIVIAGLLAMLSIIIAMMVRLPKKCNPYKEWYKGNVFYEIFPASFQDSNGDGIGDFKGLASRTNYLKNLGVAAIRLNSIFPTTHLGYPENYQTVKSLYEIDDVLGTKNDFETLVKTLHLQNISVILDLPIYPFIKQFTPANYNFSDTLNETSSTLVTDKIEKNVFLEENVVTESMRLWLATGVDGFYIKGLENLINDPYFTENIKEWKYILGSDRVLIISDDVYWSVSEQERGELKKVIDLVDVFLDVSNGTEFIAKQIKKVLKDETCSGPITHWTLGGVAEKRLSSGLTSNATLASTLLQLMLPGTPSIFYGDEISLQKVHDPLGEHSDNKHLHHLSTMAWEKGVPFTSREALPWLPRGASASFHHFDYVANMIALRFKSPSIYKTSIFREGQAIINTAVRYIKNDILILERRYPRRNTFISVSNFSNMKNSLDLSSMFYSGVIVLGTATGNQIFFSDLVIGPMETLIVKLDK